MPYGSPDDATGEGLCKDWPAFQFDAGGQIRVITTLRLPGLQDFQGAVIELGAAAASGGGKCSRDESSNGGCGASMQLVSRICRVSSITKSFLCRSSRKNRAGRRKQSLSVRSGGVAQTVPRPVAAAGGRRTGRRGEPLVARSAADRPAQVMTGQQLLCDLLPGFAGLDAET